MRRLHLRGRENILNRLVVHAGAANLGLLMRKMSERERQSGFRAEFRPQLQL
jgi:hypothetical protein